MENLLELKQYVHESRNGNRESFGEIVRRLQGMISAVIYNIVGDFHRSEDLTQETFLLAWEKLDQLDENEKFPAWIRKIAINLAHGSFRNRSSQEKTVPQQQFLERVFSRTMPVQPETEAMKNETDALVWSAISRVPATLREPLILYYRQGESTQNIAVLLDITEGTLQKRISRGRKLLKKELEQMVGRSISAATPGETFAYGVVVLLPTTMVSSPTVQTVAAGIVGVVSNPTSSQTALFGSGTQTATSFVWLGFGFLLAALGSILSGLGLIFSTFFGAEDAVRKESGLAARRSVVQSIVSLYIGVWGMLTLAAVIDLIVFGFLQKVNFQLISLGPFWDAFFPTAAMTSGFLIPLFWYRILWHRSDKRYKDAIAVDTISADAMAKENTLEPGRFSLEQLKGNIQRSYGILAVLTVMFVGTIIWLSVVNFEIGEGLRPYLIQFNILKYSFYGILLTGAHLGYHRCLKRSIRMCTDETSLVEFKPESLLTRKGKYGLTHIDTMIVAYPFLCMFLSVACSLIFTMGQMVGIGIALVTLVMIAVFHMVKQTTRPVLRFFLYGLYFAGLYALSGNLFKYWMGSALEDHFDIANGAHFTLALLISCFFLCITMSVGLTVELAKMLKARIMKRNV